MSGKTIVEIEGIIQRDYIRKRVKDYMCLNRHDLQNQLTNKVIQKCVIFITGYVKCLKYHGIQPINLVEMESLLMQECIDWTVEYLEEGGN